MCSAVGSSAGSKYSRPFKITKMDKVGLTTSPGRAQIREQYGLLLPTGLADDY
ncbi:MAG TPA: hypothetical protein VE665_06110 [Hyphomicrobiaceae bacterium]|jgi:hypothetical protein|nr:hypothetical protein [Hyphomicrobiaceae bacterium]